MNKVKIKSYVSNALHTIIAVMLLWIAVSGIIQRFKCPSMTETELFLNIPKYAVFNWKHCSFSAHNVR